MSLQENLKLFRVQKGFSQEQLAEKLDLSRQAIAKWESGMAVPELDKLVALADLYQTTLDGLVRGIHPCASYQPSDMNRDTDVLIDFLLRAASKTYAAHGKESDTPSRPGAHDLVYTEGDYLYMDSYLGGQQFIGGETVYRGGVCLWGMNFYGRTLDEGFSGDFHKAALLQRPRDMPFRGPKLYRDGRYTYHNVVEGNFELFIGREEVFYDDRRVFECVYHGGRVQA